jgi:phosphate transport system substrate-binding protein
MLFRYLVHRLKRKVLKSVIIGLCTLIFIFYPSILLPSLPSLFSPSTITISQVSIDTHSTLQMWEPAAEGNIKSWNQVRSDFPNQPLSLYGPDRESGTYDYFTLAVVGEEGKNRTDYAPSKTDDALVQGVAANPNALGFFGYAYYLANQDKLKLVAVDSGAGCVQPNPQTIADSRYQPLSRPVFLYVKKSAAERAEVKAFTNFYLDPENANLVLQVGDVPLPIITWNNGGKRSRTIFPRCKSS